MPEYITFNRYFALWITLSIFRIDGCPSFASCLSLHLKDPTCFSQYAIMLYRGPLTGLVFLSKKRMLGAQRELLFYFFIWFFLDLGVDLRISIKAKEKFFGTVSWIIQCANALYNLYFQNLPVALEHRCDWGRGKHCHLRGCGSSFLPLVLSF